LLRRRIELHRNVVRVGSQFGVGSLKSNKNRTVVVPAFVMDALAASAAGKGREDLLWTAPYGGYLRPPGGESCSPARWPAARRPMRPSPG